MHITYSITSSSIDAIPKALSMLRRRLIPVTDFSAQMDAWVFDLMLTIDIPEGHEERFSRLFEKVYEIDTVEWWTDTEN